MPRPGRRPVGPATSTLRITWPDRAAVSIAQAPSRSTRANTGTAASASAQRGGPPSPPPADGPKWRPAGGSCSTPGRPLPPPGIRDSAGMGPPMRGFGPVVLPSAAAAPPRTSVRLPLPRGPFGCGVAAVSGGRVVGGPVGLVVLHVEDWRRIGGGVARGCVAGRGDVGRLVVGRVGRLVVEGSPLEGSVVGRLVVRQVAAGSVPRTAAAPRARRRGPVVGVRHWAPQRPPG